MNSRIYVETSVISYLAARDSNDPANTARKNASLALWNARECYALHISDTVIEECVVGDTTAVARRMSFCQQLPVLTLPPLAVALASRLIESSVMPQKAYTDAVHIAVAALYNFDYIASWNFRHIAGAIPRRRIENALQSWGFTAPIIATPEEILEGI